MKCPESIEELAELEKNLPLCKVTLFEQAQARLKKNPEKSERQVAKDIAEELDEDPGKIRTAIRRADKEIHDGSSEPPTLYEFSNFKLTEFNEEQAVLKHAKIIKRDRREQRQQIREEQRQEIIEKAPPLDGHKYKLLHGDFRTSDIKPQSIDAIITDPPYGFDYLPLYKNLSEFASQVLKPNAPCIVMIGQSWLEMSLKLLSSNLTYIWTFAFLTPGASVQVFGRKIKSNWKPVIFLVNGKNECEHIEDTIESDKRDKRFHDWGQNEEGMSQIIERLTVKGDVILDPFCGSSATGMAAVSLDRFFIGIDTDEYAIKQSGERLLDAGRSL